MDALESDLEALEPWYLKLYLKLKSCCSCCGGKGVPDMDMEEGGFFEETFGDLKRGVGL